MKFPASPIGFAALMPHAPVLVPEVGGRRVSEVAASVGAMREVASRAVAHRPDSVLVISPHSPRRHDAFGLWAGETLAGSLAAFGAPQARFELPIDADLRARIAVEASRVGCATWSIRGGELDHGAVVPLWFLVEGGWRGPTVVVSLNYPGEGGLVGLGQAIAAAAGALGRRLVIIASGDMSHRLLPGAPCGFEPKARDFDRGFMEVLRRGDYHALERLDPDLQELAAEDAVDSTVVAAAAGDWSSAGHRVLSYEGPFGVGYGVAVLFEGGEAGPGGAEPTDSATTAASHPGQQLPAIARRSLEAAFGRETVDPPPVPEGYLREPRAVFVTLRSAEGELRGCVGRLTPLTGSVAEETWAMARDAAFHDGRFPSVSREELPGLQIEVSVLFPPEPVASPDELDPTVYGVVVRSEDGRRGVLLPGIEEVRTVRQQLAIARRKAGIAADEPVRLERFRVEKFEEAVRTGA